MRVDVSQPTGAHALAEQSIDLLGVAGGRDKAILDCVLNDRLNGYGRGTQREQLAKQEHELAGTHRLRTRR